ncbi:hypothetical protein AXF42_Ash013369 [Apostasia shenzhenica]|uniref:Uncharacterized protein n=1 Tax=Apostasia shenzhenica TaxID=1088818 RepID=A0A2I0A413_9ASPA|nr:hypothetical protein AXF42_Ash013369 [Apostasia shenzhenica]
MSLGYCISAIACHPINDEGLKRQCPRANCESKLVASQSDVMQCSADELLDALGIVILKSKQHFNAKYRLQVSEQVLKAASLLTCTSDMSLVVLLHFLSAVPREFVDVNGPLRSLVQAWLTQNCEQIDFGPSENQSHLLKNLFNFPLMFIALASKDSLSFDDEDVDSWLYEAQRWARVLFLVIRMENDLDPVFEFFRSYGGYLSQGIPGKWIGVKLLILILCFAEESEIILKKLKYDGKVRIGAEFSGELVNSSVETSLVTSEKFVGQFLPITEDVLCFARHVLAVFWSNSSVKDTLLPSSMTGKLGGPARRRLGTSMTSSVLQSIVAMRTIATIVSLTFLIKGDVLYSTFTFFWEFIWKVVQFHPHKSETGSELCLASYETLSFVLKTLSANFDASAFASLTSDNKLAFACGNGKAFLDHILVCFLNGINDLLANGVLTHSRRAILMDWKWNCLDSVMSIPYNVVKKGSPSSRCPLFSDSILRTTLADIIESLEAAGENSVLSMLRSLRLILGLLCSTKVGSVLSSSHGLNTQVMFQLVRSAWILHQSCNKRRVAPIAALLSAVLHESVFGDLTMHEMNGDEKGPLKWFIENLIDEGIKSPRTMRLAAMHLTGLWLLHPRTLKYYVKELKLMSLYGSVAFDEDFESELCENQDAKTEVSHLAQSPDPELTEVFINTEMYSRISVAVLFNKLANLVNGSRNQVNGDFVAALHCGKLFLLELLDSAVKERDLSKELYKKFSGVHRRKSPLTEQQKTVKLRLQPHSFL